MDDLHYDQMLESPAERQARLVWEAEMIEEALASAAEGRVVSFVAVEAWVNSLGTANELPMPTPDLSAPRRWAHLKP